MGLPVRKFTSYAEGVIEALVTGFIRHREASRAMDFSLHSITVNTGEQVDTRGKE
ncbi:MAG: hypothetical protein RBR15_00505 [Sphaerochaeta sp.]|nr:hypothetical protein [Sphaerochaeta sp.]